MLEGRVAIAATCALLLACGSDKRSEPEEVSRDDRPAGRGGIVVPPVTIPPITIPEIPIPDLSGIFMCDPDASSESSCGAESCPALPAYMASSCYVNCCTDDGRCGTRNTAPQFGPLLGQCTAPGISDPRCPDLAIAGATFAGCCDAQNRCAVIVGQYCTSTLVGSLGVPIQDCDQAADAGD